MLGADGCGVGQADGSFLGVLVPLLRSYGELDLDDATAVLLCRMSTATITAGSPRAGEAGRAGTLAHQAQPGSLLNDAIPMRSWADWDDAVPGFVEIDLVGHEGGNFRNRDNHRLLMLLVGGGLTPPPPQAKRTDDKRCFMPGRANARLSG